MPRHADGDMVNCDQVQEHLSAYHDGMLDAATAEVVRVHLATCPRCPAILADYDRLDRILAQAPRVGPSPALRDRIFSSPEFREIVAGQQPGAVTKPPSAPIRIPPRARLGPQAARVWLPVIVLIVLLSGTTAVISKILASRATGPAYATCATLSGGQRLVYRSGDALYSNDAPLVCEPKTQVGLWQTSPDGRWVVYLNDRTHTLRLVRANATQDHQIAIGAGTLESLVWSPDSQRFFFAQITANTPNGVTFWSVDTSASHPQRSAVMTSATLDGSSATQSEKITTAGQPVVSPDGQSIAVAVKRSSGAYAVTVFPTTPQTSGTLAHISNFSSGFPIDALGWTSGSQPILTWIAGINSGNAGFSSLPHGASIPGTTVVNIALLGDITAAALNPVSGQWAVASINGTVTAIDVRTGAQTPLAQVGTVTALSASPDGNQWLITSRNILWLLTDTGLTKITDTLGIPAPVWSGTTVAFVANDKVQITQTQGGKISTQAADATGVGTIAGLAWSSNGGALAIWGSAGTATVSPNGQQLSLVMRVASGAPQWTAWE